MAWHGAQQAKVGGGTAWLRRRTRHSFCSLARRPLRFPGSYQRARVHNSSSGAHCWWAWKHCIVVLTAPTAHAAISMKCRRSVSPRFFSEVYTK